MPPIGKKTFLSSFISYPIIIITSNIHTLASLLRPLGACLKHCAGPIPLAFLHSSTLTPALIDRLHSLTHSAGPFPAAPWHRSINASVCNPDLNSFDRCAHCAGVTLLPSPHNFWRWAFDHPNGAAYYMYTHASQPIPRLHCAGWCIISKSKSKPYNAMACLRLHLPFHIHSGLKLVIFVFYQGKEEVVNISLPSPSSSVWW